MQCRGFQCKESKKSTVKSASKVDSHRAAASAERWGKRDKSDALAHTKKDWWLHFHWYLVPFMQHCIGCWKSHGFFCLGFIEPTTYLWLPMRWRPEHAFWFCWRLCAAYWWVNVLINALGNPTESLTICSISTCSAQSTPIAAERRRRRKKDEKI